MGLDIRLPIGLLFTVFGLMLSAFGLFSSPELYVRSLGIDVNLQWGIVMLVFGLVMLFLGRRGTIENTGTSVGEHGSSKK